MLTKIEKKMVAKYVYAISDTYMIYCGSAGFILSDGRIINTSDHAAVCKAIGYTLSKVIQSGICRFMFHKGKEGQIAAFEYCSLTIQQRCTISLLLRADNYFTIVTQKTTISRFRPIRSLPL